MKTSVRNGAAVAAATLLIGLASAVWTVPTHAAASQTIVGQGVYVCQSKPNGFPLEYYDVTLRMSLTAPASVAPGQTVSLSGTATLQFPEKAYQEGKSMGVTEADGYSNTLSVAATSNGSTTDVTANRWQTAPFPWRDPVVVSAPITFHPFTVPANATGSLTITLPRNERRAPNLASNSPATVAFNGVANNKTAVGNISENLGCYLQGSAPSVIATIPITSSAPPPNTNGTPDDTGAQPGTPGDTAPQADPTAAPDPGSDQAPTGTGQQSGPTDTAPQAAPNSTTQIASNPAGGPTLSTQGDLYPPGTTRSGVFVNTNVMLLTGGLICIVALAYAFLTQYRLRNLKRAIDDR